MSPRMGIKEKIRKTVEGALIPIVKESRLNKILVQNVGKPAKSNSLFDTLTRRSVGSTSIITLMVELVYQHV